MPAQPQVSARRRGELAESERGAGVSRLPRIPVGQRHRLAARSDSTIQLLIGRALPRVAGLSRTTNQRSGSGRSRRSRSVLPGSAGRPLVSPSGMAQCRCTPAGRSSAEVNGGGSRSSGDLSSIRLRMSPRPVPDLPAGGDHQGLQVDRHQQPRLPGRQLGQLLGLGVHLAELGGRGPYPRRRSGTDQPSCTVFSQPDICSMPKFVSIRLTKPVPGTSPNRCWYGYRNGGVAGPSPRR